MNSSWCYVGPGGRAWRMSALAHEFSAGLRRGRLQMAGAGTLGATPALSRAWHRLHWCLPAWRHSPSGIRVPHTLRARQRGWHFAHPTPQRQDSLSSW